MKRLNKKGFTLIELLAVIVILAILVTVSIPSVTKYMDNSRKETFAINVSRAVEAIRTDISSGAVSSEKEYSLSEINDLLDKKLIKSSYDNAYDNSSYIKVTIENDRPVYEICIIDEKGNGIYNKTTSNSKNVENNIQIKCGLQNLDTSGANEPELASNMIPVYYDGSVWRKADDENKLENYKWYDYDEHKWANAVTVTEAEGTRADLINAILGTEIPISRINTMWVWIPRYKYTVFNYNLSGGIVVATEQPITITFEKGTAKTGEISCADAIDGVANHPSESCKVINTDDDCTDEICNGKTYTHPAFTFGNQNLKGFWMGKFEVNYSGGIRIIPNVGTYTNESIGGQFSKIQVMTNDGNIYGFNKAIDASADTHMTKNMEWGAVAYLTQSVYGRYVDTTTCITSGCEVWINPIATMAQYSGAYQNSITGCSYNDKNATARWSHSSCDSGYEYNGLNNNGKSSTTGNVYGVYDMNGGTLEHVMANMVGNGTTTFYNLSSNFSSIPDSKYYNLYNYGTTLEGADALKRGKLGDGMRETMKALSRGGGWYGDSAYFPNSGSSVWLTRGRLYDNAGGAGIFGYEYGSYADCCRYPGISTRTVLTLN